MDVLAKRKSDGVKLRMTEQVYALNGGDALYDLVDYEGSETFEANKAEQKVVDPDKISFAERMAAATAAAGVIVATSTVVAEPGKLEAAQAAANSPFADLAKEVATSESKPVQPGVKSISLAEIQAGLGSTMGPHDASPEATANAKAQEPNTADQPGQIQSPNIAHVDNNGTVTITPGDQTAAGNSEGTASQTNEGATGKGETGDGGAAEKKSPNE